MQYLSTEVGKLCRFLEVELAHGFRVLHEARVVVVHAVDVGPNLYLLGIDSSSEQAGTIVAAAPLEVVYLAVCVAADKALSQIDLVAGIGLEHLGSLFLDVVHVRLGILVGADDVECVDEQRLYPTFLQVIGDHVGAYYLALSQDDLLLERRKVDFGEGTQVVELLLQEIRGSLPHFFGLVEA